MTKKSKSKKSITKATSKSTPRNTLSDITDEKFVTAWQESTSVKAVAEKLNIGYHAASQFSNKLRKQGVELKQMPRSRHGRGAPDVKKLNKLIKESAAS